ncbi:hypothetical protein L1887_38819 [Cichorium endivia]|nr:hypothetical protein L1887_38819 [Cichorium endivia]
MDSRPPELPPHKVPPIVLDFLDHGTFGSSEARIPPVVETHPLLLDCDFLSLPSTASSVASHDHGTFGSSEARIPPVLEPHPLLLDCDFLSLPSTAIPIRPVTYSAPNPVSLNPCVGIQRQASDSSSPQLSILGSPPVAPVFNCPTTTSTLPCPVAPAPIGSSPNVALIVNSLLD